MTNYADCENCPFKKFSEDMRKHNEQVGKWIEQGMSDYNGEPLKFRFKEGDLERLESMYNYRSPIEMIATEMQTKYENECVSVCQRYGFNVDKDELAKALAYDRNQYNMGFKDGYKQALKEQQEIRESIMKLVGGGE